MSNVNNNKQEKDNSSKIENTTTTSNEFNNVESINQNTEPNKNETTKYKTDINQKSNLSGKILKVFTNELSFGSNVRLVNAFGLFKYNKNNTNYIVYADVKNEYNLVYFATAHIKENSILTLDAKKQEDEEAIKEYIFKLTSNEDLSDFEFISLENIDTIEIIGYSKLELKPEVISKLIELTIPRKEESIKEPQSTKPKKKSLIKLILILFILLIIGLGCYLYLTNLTKQPSISKSILCKKNYPHEELEADVLEEKTLNFGNNDELQNVETIQTYQFRTNDDYLEFINQAQYYKYMPEETAANGGFKLDDENSRYIVNIKDEVTDTYTLPTSYEDVLSYYKKQDYTCEESITE